MTGERRTSDGGLNQEWWHGQGDCEDGPGVRQGSQRVGGWGSFMSRESCGGGLDREREVYARAGAGYINSNWHVTALV